MSSTPIFEEQVVKIHTRHGAAVMMSAEIFAPLPARAPNMSPVAKGTLTLLTGRFESGKTLVTADCAVGMAGGGSCLGFAPEQLSTLYIDYENPPDELRRRVQALTRGRGLTQDLDLHLVCQTAPWMHTPKFAAYMESISNLYGLVVIDSLRRANPEVDENSSSFTAGLEVLRKISALRGTRFLVIHHQGKAQDPVRGTSAIVDAFDSILTIEKTGTNTSKISPVKDRCHFAFQAKLVRWEDQPNGGLLLHYADEDSQDDGHQVETQNAEGETRDQILTFYRQNPDANWETCRSTLQGRTEAKQKARDALLESGEIVKAGRGRYRVAE